jgi:hypothetical protein
MQTFGAGQIVLHDEGVVDHLRERKVAFLQCQPVGFDPGNV